MEENLPKTVNEISEPIPSDVVGKKIIIFGKADCPDCLRIKKYFSENAVEYEYHETSGDSKDQKQNRKWLTSFCTFVPVLIMLDGSLMYSPSNDELHQKMTSSIVNADRLSPVEPEQFDTIIIGAGPAGITAAVYAVRKALKVLLISKVIGGQAANSARIENVPGFTIINGSELATKFRQEMDKFQGEGLWIKEGVEVKSIEGTENNFQVITDSGKYPTKTVIIATGRTPKMLGVPGEKELFGKGVATCATCDGPLFKGKEVAIVGGGNSALDAASSLMKLAKSVKIINLTPDVRGDMLLLNNVKGAKNVEIINNSTLTEIKGEEFVSGVVVQNSQTHQTIEYPVEGVFIEIGWTPMVNFVPQVAKDKLNQIVVDEFGETSMPGIWAAGDVNNLWGEQIVIACGEGAKTALVVAEHIAKIPHQASSNIHEG